MGESTGKFLKNCEHRTCARRAHQKNTSGPASGGIPFKSIHVSSVDSFPVSNKGSFRRGFKICPQDLCLSGLPGTDRSFSSD